LYVALRALVFDFDGLILDTERPAYEAWRHVYQAHGCDLAMEEWADCIGRPDAWDPIERLAARVPLADPAAAKAMGKTVHDALLEAEETRPGVVELLAEGREAGLRIGIASSSPQTWVAPLLERLGLVDHFECLSCYQSDSGVRGKPHPDLFLQACQSLEVEPAEAVAFEDSLNGVAAAKTAGLWCVAVPHALTAGLDLSAADLVVDSLASLSLARLRALVDQWTRPARSVGA
jgi:HAD superfamily hydrolase (TIGR01509 family)